MKLALTLGLCAATVLSLASGAFAGVIGYEAFLDGPSESPPNASPGTGYSTAFYDDVAHTLTLHAVFSGLTGTTTAAHIHAPTAVAGTGTAGVATTTPSFAGFPLGVTAGVYDNVLDLTQASSWNPSFVTANGGTTAGAEAALVSALAAGKAYFNIHTQTFGGGEIRGFYKPLAAPVPLPPALPAGLVVLGGLAAGRWLRRHR
jgi:hypothetical protein